jgi:type II secretory pathway component PulF
MRVAYQAYDKAGVAVQSVIEAASVADATAKLRARGLFTTKVQPAGDGAKSGKAASRDAGHGGKRWMTGGARLKRLNHFTRQFYVLMASGTPVLQALEALEQQAPDRVSAGLVHDVRVHVEQGGNLTDALSARPEMFDEVYRSLVAAGEQAGKLTPMLQRLSELTQKQLKLYQAVRGALAYPIVLVTVAIGVLGLMLAVVVPRFAGLFESLAVPLPASTQLLLVIGGVVRAYWWAIGLGMVGALCGAVMTLRSDAGRAAVHKALVTWPMIGKLTQSLITARIVRLLGTLIDSHLPLLDVLDLTRRSCANPLYRELLTGAKEAVQQGEAIGSAFVDQPLIAPSVAAAVQAGEGSGRLGSSLLNMAELMDEENQVLIKTMLSMLEPAILLVLGVVIGLMAMSIFLPLFDLAAAAGGGG